MKWTESKFCSGLGTCTTCRAKTLDGERFRQEVAARYSVPAPYWPCPRKAQRLWAWATGKKPKVARWGDRVHWICQALGINRVTTWLEGKGINCGCKNRRLMMNQLGLMGWAGYAWKQRNKRDEQTA